MQGGIGKDRFKLPPIQMSMNAREVGSIDGMYAKLVVEEDSVSSSKQRELAEAAVSKVKLGDELSLSHSQSHSITRSLTALME